MQNICRMRKNDVYSGAALCYTVLCKLKCGGDLP